ncbi:transcriptional regulator GutM [Nocardioides cynanchi]|uniref:transcriptional regulator GutM n=1 Tax=Nocardioides cynanchi TaxID=2558918 RepID=UPI001247001E|nr:transcriptional regulator GutM [Nocardioides cynanchi]
MWFAIIAAVVAGWMVQLYFSFHQATAFNKAVVALRAQGTVSVGAGGKRYRGGRAFVAIAVDERDTVVDAITLQGLTTFARARALPGACGQTLRRLGSDREIPALTRQQREAARQAATLFVEGRERATRDAEGGVPTSAG